MRHSRILSPLAVCIPAVVVCAMSASAQTITGAPVSGAVFDTSTHSIRAILGVPGAAYLGSPAVSVWDLAAPSPDGKKALGVRGSSLSLIPDLSHPDNSTAIGSVMEAVDRIGWSADSSAAVLFCARSNQLQRVTGLATTGSANTPAIQAPVNASGAGAIAGWSISLDGASLAYSTPLSSPAGAGRASQAGASGGVWLVSGSNAPIRLGSFTDPGALTFSPDGASLFVFDRASGRIVRVQVSSGAVMDSFAANAAGAVSSAAATESATAAVRGTVRRVPPRNPSSQVDIRDFAVTDDGALLLAIQNQSLCVYDTAGHNGDRCQSIDAKADSIQAITPGVFVLNYARTGALPVWLWDRAAGAVYFVPSGRSVTNASN